MAHTERYPKNPGTADVVQLAARAGIEVRPESLRSNSTGLDFHVVFADDMEGQHWVLRIPRRDDVPPRAVLERRTLSLVREFVSFETPNWQVCDDELIAYRSLRGRPAGTFTAERREYVWGSGGAEVPDRFTTSLAPVLAELHRVPADRAAAAGLPVVPAEELRTTTAERMRRVREVFAVDETLWDRWQTWIGAEELWPAETGLVHGDLHPGHILVDAQHAVTGILDWTEAKVEDVSTDFVYHYMAFGEEELRTLIGRYEEAGGRAWPQMAEHVIELAAAFPLNIAEFAMATQTGELETMARELLGTPG